MLNLKQQQIREQGDRIIWDWIARKQEEFTTKLDELYKQEKVVMKGSKCPECGSKDMRLHVHKYVLAKIDKVAADYLLAKELMTCDSGAELYCSDCLHREPCDVHYQVEKL